MHILFVTPEVAPFSSSGELGELTGALPRLLQERGARVTVVTPFYRDIVPERFGLARRLRRLEVPLPGAATQVAILDGKFPNCDASVIFIDHPESFQREGYYSGSEGPYPDNHRRFFLLCRAALCAITELGIDAQILHAHDWQTALLPLLVRRGALPGSTCKTVFTVHDAALAPLFERSTLDELGLGSDLFTPEAIEFHGKVNPLKAGVIFADRVTTLSPSYARGLQTEELGCGLQGLFTAVGDKLDGVLPGVDRASWNPETDHRLAERYRADDLSGKEACKRALQTALGLQLRGGGPLLVFVGQLSEARGVALVSQVAPQLLQLKAQLAILGAPSAEAVGPLRQLAEANPESVALAPLADDAALRRAIAGADALLLPAHHEPGGTLAIKALRYGTVPVVRDAAGPRDTVVDFDPVSGTGTGVHFGAWSPEGLLSAVRRVAGYHQDSKLWGTLVQNAMRQVYGWDQTASRYLAIYDQLLGQR
jgi:starch synthase